MSCPARFPIFIGADGWSPVQCFQTDRPGFLTCVLEEGHQGAHCSPPPAGLASTPLAWEFIPGGDYELAAGELATARLPSIDSHQRIPPWWVAQQCDEVFGEASPRLFHPVLELDPPPSAQTPAGDWGGPAF